MVGRPVNTLLLAVTFEILSVSVPLLVTVTAVSLKEPTLTVPKLMFEILNAMIGKNVVPVPVTPTVSGVVSELLVTEILAAASPTPEGVNRIVSTMDWPGKIVPTVGRAVKADTLEEISVILSVSVPEFEIVIVISLN